MNQRTQGGCRQLQLGTIKVELNSTCIENNATSPAQPLPKLPPPPPKLTHFLVSPIHRNTYSSESSFNPETSLSIHPSKLTKDYSTGDIPEQPSKPKGTLKCTKRKGERYNWLPDDPHIQNFPFNENVGLKVYIPADADPITSVRLLLTDELIARIRDSTNAYAAGVIDASRLDALTIGFERMVPYNRGPAEKVFWHSIAYGTGWHAFL